MPYTTSSNHFPIYCPRDECIVHTVPNGLEAMGHLCDPIYTTLKLSKPPNMYATPVSILAILEPYPRYSDRVSLPEARSMHQLSDRLYRVNTRHGKTHPVHPDRLAVNPGRLGASQERHKRCHLFRQADPLLRMKCLEEFNLLFCLARPEHVGVDGPWGYGVDGDALGSELLGEDAVDLFDGAFAGAVQEGGRRDTGERRESRREEDNSAAFVTE